VFAILIEDMAALLGLLIALIGVYFGHLLNNPYLDGAASILIGIMLVGVATFLIYKTKGLLVGEGVDDATIDAIEKLARQDSAVEQTRRPLTLHLGPHDVVLALDIDFHDNLTSVEVEDAIERLQDNIKAQHPEFKRIFIEAKSITDVTHKASI
jgi:divalent metal cation (Fe/Co/Zn/Cd) transporter